MSKLTDMKNIYNARDYQGALDFIASLNKTNDELVELVLQIGRVFKKDNKEFRQGHFEECVWSKEDYQA